MLVRGADCLCRFFEVGFVSLPDSDFWKAFPKILVVTVTASAEMK